MKKIFENWLLDKGYAINTAYSYSNAINKIEDYYLQQNNLTLHLYKQETKLNTIQLCMKDLKKEGQYAEFGNKGHNTNKAAIIAYYKFRQGFNQEDAQKPNTQDVNNEQQHQNIMKFTWIPFFKELACKLLEYRQVQATLKKDILHIIKEVGYSTEEPKINEIDPFTIFAFLNRVPGGEATEKRQKLAGKYKDYFKMMGSIPQAYNGVPVVPPMSSWFFAFDDSKRGKNDITNLWELFTLALNRGKEQKTTQDDQLFCELFDKILHQHSIGEVYITISLYWIDPDAYAPIDQHSREFIINELGMNVPKIISGHSYLELIANLKSRFSDDNCPVRSFPELSLKAWEANKNVADEKRQMSTKPYTIQNIIEDGCFLDIGSLKMIIEQLKFKRNLILQGPPGTGKTWLAKRLAYALIEQTNDSSIRAVQFHPNLSYEDFVRGWRPSSEGRLTLVDGPFLEMVEKAKNDAYIKHVMVIEEINRGNPAQIFGEMLTLLEADKHNSSASLELSYRKVDDEKVYIPDNLYVIGTMNIADRSLALVDLALRRRFAFFTLQPIFNTQWINWVSRKNGIDSNFLKKIGQRLISLNNEISNDRTLGDQFKIGHSYVTPSPETTIEDQSTWFRRVVDFEIVPLLEEYWFDNLERANEARNALIKDI